MNAVWRQMPHASRPVAPFAYGGHHHCRARTGNASSAFPGREFQSHLTVPPRRLNELTTLHSTLCVGECASCPRESNPVIPFRRAAGALTCCRCLLLRTLVLGPRGWPSTCRSRGGCQLTIGWCAQRATVCDRA